MLGSYFVRCSVLNCDIEYCIPNQGSKLIEGKFYFLNNKVTISANTTGARRILVSIPGGTNIINNNTFIFDEENSEYGAELFINASDDLSLFCTNNYFRGIGFYINDSNANICFDNNILSNTKNPRITLVGNQIIGKYINNGNVVTLN